MAKREKLTVPKKDRRTLSNIPDPDGIRKTLDRRGNLMKDETNPNTAYQARMNGKRYMAKFPVNVRLHGRKVKASCVDISNTGMLVQIPHADLKQDLEANKNAKLTFTIPPAAMPEGYEAKFKLQGKVVRHFNETTNAASYTYCAFEFEQSLESYLKKRRWGLSIFTASLLLFFMMLIVILMRTESVIYFKFNKFLYFYSLIAATFLLSRYVFGMVYRNVPVNLSYEPGVSIVIPVFNEEEWIERTILGCIDQTYPIDKLEVIIVDDCSTDGSVEKIKETVAKIYREGHRFKTEERLKFIQLPKNAGKREALVEGTKAATHELVVFVDSDSFLEPNAIRNIVQPFQDPKMGGVSGRTEVENKFTNALTKLQTVRYYIAFRIMKAAEATFDCVTCLSGPLSCYRKSLVLDNAEAWLNQRFLGHPATFGDDRSMTNFILKTHRTGYQDKAVCSTIVPSDFHVFLKQQMRWKRSWLRESLRALTFMIKKEPFMQLFFLVGLIVPIAAPVVVAFNLLYVPLMHGIFPTTFIVGLLVMALMMSFAHLFFRKSTLWFFGFVFVMYYEFILLWQMPVAWVTFWKSTWGTRETPQDVEARQKKELKKALRRKKRQHG
ncbi:glycosyltransferase [Gracilibacillus alcaliphilus]|uniref:glycosyltransferase n=1 Tax=Gracilibacillus alcaliphilus TaxID=1401441 RepID=UPI00195D44CA|nr:glycosyltransferase [Gracilibacillus alcaliphilus]MBM7676362.1 hyaluronan synthase [Gracilibacillus alcaliphilus]